jgi:hypothetical protein
VFDVTAPISMSSPAGSAGATSRKRRFPIRIVDFRGRHPKSTSSMRHRRNAGMPPPLGHRQAQFCTKGGRIIRQTARLARSMQLRQRRV